MILPVLIFASVSLAVFWPVLFGGQIIVNHYASYVHYPIFYYFGLVLKTAGTAPLWISNYLSGFPTYLSQQGGFLSPITILFFKIFDFPFAYHLLTFVNFSLAGVFMYLFAREMSFSKAAGIVAGLAFMFNRLNLFLGGQMPVFSNLLPLMPLLFFLIVKIHKNEKNSTLAMLILFAGTSFALAWLGGFTETVFYLAISLFGFAVFLDFSRLYRENSWQFNLKRLKTVFASILALAIGAALAGPWLLPTYNFASLTPRSGGITVGEAVPVSSSFFKEFYNALFPFLNTGPNGALSFVFIGVLVYLFAFFALYSLNKVGGNKFIFFFAGLLLFTFLVFFGPSHFYVLLHKLPFFKFFSGPWKWAFMANFSLAILAGFGLDRLRDLDEKRKFLFQKIFLAGFAVLVIFFLWVVILKPQLLVVAFFVSSFFIAVSLLIFFSYLRGIFSFSVFKKLVIFLLALNFIFGWRDMFIFMPAKKYLAKPAAANFILRETGHTPFRVFTASKPNEYVEILKTNKKEALVYDLAVSVPNINIMQGVGLMGGNEAFNTRRSEIILNKKDLYKSLSLLSMLNVKYLLSSFELPLPLTKVFETKATKYNIPVYIYENPDVLPRVYFAKTPVYTKETNEDKLFEELLKIDNFKEKTLIECSEPICQAKTETSTNDNSQITIKELKNGYLKLETKTDSPRWLIYSESNLPTWEARLRPLNRDYGGQATIDNQPTRIYTANYIYQAIFVPEGEWEVEIKYGGVWKQMKYAILNLI